MTPYVYRRHARNPKTIIGLWLMAVFIAALWLKYDASPIILGMFAFVAIPALWDVVRNPENGMTLNDETWVWYSGRKTGEIAIQDIAKVTFHSGLDGSRRIVILDHVGNRTRLPAESTPKHTEIKPVLDALGISHRDQHFMW